MRHTSIVTTPTGVNWFSLPKRSQLYLVFCHFCDPAPPGVGGAVLPPVGGGGAQHERGGGPRLLGLLHPRLPPPQQEFKWHDSNVLERDLMVQRGGAVERQHFLQYITTNLLKDLLAPDRIQNLSKSLS